MAQKLWAVAERCLSRKRWSIGCCYLCQFARGWVWSITCNRPQKSQGMQGISSEKGQKLWPPLTFFAFLGCCYLEYKSWYFWGNIFPRRSKNTLLQPKRLPRLWIWRQGTSLSFHSQCWNSVSTNQVALTHRQLTECPKWNRCMRRNSPLSWKLRGCQGCLLSGMALSRCWRDQDLVSLLRWAPWLDLSHTRSSCTTRLCLRIRGLKLKETV